MSNKFEVKSVFEIMQVTLLGGALLAIVNTFNTASAQAQEFIRGGATFITPAGFGSTSSAERQLPPGSGVGGATTTTKYLFINGFPAAIESVNVEPTNQIVPGLGLGNGNTRNNNVDIPQNIFVGPGETLDSATMQKIRQGNGINGVD